MFTKFTDLVGIWVGMINLTFVWRSPKGCCYLLWQPVKFWGCSQTSPWTTFSLCSDVRQQIRRSWSWRFHGNNPATSCTNLVRFRPIISEFTLLKHAVSAATRPQFDNIPSSGTLVFRNRLEYRNFDFRRVNGNHFCTSCRNMVRFVLVTLDFKTYEIVQPASKILLE